MLSTRNRLSSFRVCQQLLVHTKAAVGLKAKLEAEKQCLPRSQDFYRRLMIEPKRHINEFSIFTKKNWVKGIPVTEQSKRLAKLWHSLSDEDKQPYKDASRTLKEELSKRTTELLEDMTCEERLEKIVNETSEGKVPKDHLRRKINVLDRISKDCGRLPWNAWALFLRDHFYLDGRKCTDEEYENKLGAESVARNKRGRAKLICRVRELATKWKIMSPEEKKVYRRRYDILLQQRAREYSEHQQFS